MQQDTNTQSFFRGRNGAAVLAAASAIMTVYGVSEQEQAALSEAVPAALATGSAVLALISKLRERVK